MRNGIIALLLAVAAGLALAAGPAAAACRTATSTISSRHGITCTGAKRVVRGAVRAQVSFPECRGQDRSRYRGWVLTGIGRLGIATRFRDGRRRSFVISGGGAC